MNTCMTMSMLISITFTMTKHPLSMGITLMMQALMISMITGLTTNMFWFSFILTISMITGMLVMFIYMTSIASNEKFNTQMKTPTMIMITYLYMKTTWKHSDQVDTKKTWSENMKGGSEGVYLLFKMFNTHNHYTTIMTILYLLLTMIAITYLVSMGEGPLRKKTNE